MMSALKYPQRKRSQELGRDTGIDKTQLAKVELLKWVNSLRRSALCYSLLLYMLDTCHNKKLKANTIFRLLPFQFLIFFLLYKGTARRLERICVKEQ